MILFKSTSFDLETLRLRFQKIYEKWTPEEESDLIEVH